MAVRNKNLKEDTEMGLNLEMLLRCIQLLDEEKIKQALTIHRKALDKGCFEKLITPVDFKKYRDLKNHVFNNGELEMSEILTKEEVREFIEGNNFIKDHKWSLWVLIMFLLVPEGKFVTRKFIEEIIEGWGYGRSKESLRAGKFINNSTIMTTLNIFCRTKGFLEKKDLTRHGEFCGEDAAEERKRWCEENVHGSVSITYGSRTQSVFCLIEKGRNQALEILKKYPVPVKDSLSDLSEYEICELKELVVQEYYLHHPKEIIVAITERFYFTDEEAKSLVVELCQKTFNEFIEKLKTSL